MFSDIERCVKVVTNSGHQILIPNVDPESIIHLAGSCASLPGKTAYVVIGDGWSDLVQGGKIFTANISFVHELKEFRGFGSRVLSKLDTAARLNDQKNAA